MRPLGLPRRLRIRSRRDYQSTFDAGRSLRDGLIVAYVKDGDPGRTRVGTAISKKGRNGVQRNQIRRMLREAFRLERPQMPDGMDWILLVARDATALALEPTRASLARIARRLRERARSRPAPPPSQPPAAPGAP